MNIIRTFKDKTLIYNILDSIEITPEKVIENKEGLYIIVEKLTNEENKKIHNIINENKQKKWLNNFVDPTKKNEFIL